MSQAEQVSTERVSLRTRIRWWRYLASKKRERIIVSIAWHMPRAIAYWCAIRVGANATTGEYSNQIVPELRFLDALRRWEKK